jgi:fibronectin-binding autotransporter adhesin
MNTKMRRISATRWGHASSARLVGSGALRGSAKQMLEFHSPATATNFALDSSGKGTAKRFPDPMLSNRAFAIFFIVTILIAMTLLLAPKAGAATQWWDSSNANGLTPGNGNWSTSGNGNNLNFANSATPGTVNPVNWVNGNDAIFEASGTSAVTVANGTVTVNSILFNGTGYIIGGTTLTLVGANITTNADATISAILDGTVGLTKLGGSILTLSGVNIYTGGTTLSAGTLKLSGSGTLGSTSGSLTVNAGTLDLNGTSQSVGNFTGTGGTVLNNNTGTNVTLTIGTGNATGGNYSGGIADHTSGTGTVALTKTGTGTITLSGTNSYSGLTTVSGGTLILTGSNSSGGATTVNSNTTLQLGAGTNGGLASGLLTLTGTLRSTDANARTISNNVTIGGATTTWGAASTGALTINGTMNLNASGGTRTLSTVSDTTFANAVSGSAGDSLTKTGSGTLTFSGSAANTYTGTTTVNVGELDLNKTAGVNAIAGNLTIGDGTSTDTVKLLASNQIANTSVVTLTNAASAVFNLNNQSEVIGSLTDSTAGTSTSAVQLGTGTLTFGDSSNRTYGGVISGTGGNIVKQGSGTQTLTGNNSYTGTTTINASGGTLEINNTNSASSGRISGTSGVTVNSGGTLLLSGSGAFTDRINDSATMTLNGGTFNTGGLTEAGGSTGSRTFGIGALTLSANSTIDFGSGTSIIEFMGLGLPAHTPTTGPDLALLNWTGTPFAPGGTDQLLFKGNISDFTSQYSQSDVSFNGVAGYDIFQITTGANGYYEVTEAPEPSTWVVAALALGAIGYSQRRRFARRTTRAT